MRDANGAGERVVNLGAKGTIKLGEGDRIVICSPGGGGWGAASEGAAEAKTKKRAEVLAGGSVNSYRARQETN